MAFTNFAAAASAAVTNAARSIAGNIPMVRNLVPEDTSAAGSETHQTTTSHATREKHLRYRASRRSKRSKIEKHMTAGTRKMTKRSSKTDEVVDEKFDVLPSSFLGKMTREAFRSFGFVVADSEMCSSSGQPFNTCWPCAIFSCAANVIDFISSLPESKQQALLRGFVSDVMPRGYKNIYASDEAKFPKVGDGYSTAVELGCKLEEMGRDGNLRNNQLGLLLQDTGYYVARFTIEVEDEWETITLRDGTKKEFPRTIQHAVAVFIKDDDGFIVDSDPRYPIFHYKKTDLEYHDKASRDEKKALVKGFFAVFLDAKMSQVYLKSIDKIVAMQD
jgi:hypothetical protein